MKKQIIAFVLVCCTLVFFCGIPAFGAGLNPYVSFSATLIDDYQCNRPAFSVSKGFLGGLQPGDWACYKGLNFGDVTPYALEIEIASPPEYAGKVELRLDAPNGPVIASIDVIPSSFLIPATHNVKILSEFTGTHDIYIMNAVKTSNIFKMAFYAKTLDKSGYAEFDDWNKFKNISDQPYVEEINAAVDLGFIKHE